MLSTDEDRQRKIREILSDYDTYLSPVDKYVIEHGKCEIMYQHAGFQFVMDNIGAITFTNCWWPMCSTDKESCYYFWAFSDEFHKKK